MCARVVCVCVYELCLGCMYVAMCVAFVSRLVLDSPVLKSVGRCSGMTVEVVRDEGRTPVIVFEVPASPNYPRDETVLLYGHMVAL
jgi:hypothetical protein